MKNMKAETFIESLPKMSEDEVLQNKDIIESLIESNDIYLKCCLAQELCFFQNDVTCAALLRLLRDKSGIVRAVSADSLSCYDNPEVYEALRSMLFKEKSKYAKSYEITAICEISVRNGKKPDKEVIEFILRTEKSTRSKYIKIACHGGLYLLGYEDRLQKLFEIYVKTDDYRNKCAVVNALADLLSKDNNDTIRDFASEAVNNTDSEAVKDSLLRLLEYITES